MNTMTAPASASTHRLLAVDDLRVAGPEGTLLAGISLELHAGRALTLLGESGSGKSLLAHALMGSLPAGLHASGRLEIQGLHCDAGDRDTRRPLWGRGLALLPQEPWFALDPTMRVGAQLAETYRLVGGASRGEARERTRHELAAIGLDQAARAWPFTLSGGMAQRAAFTMTRAGNAPLLIVDEPTKGLDAAWRDDIVARLREALAQGCAVLTITHDLAVARALGGEIAVMLEGAIVEHGDAATVLDRPRHAYTRALIDAQPCRWPAQAHPQTGEIVLEASGVGKRFGARTLFQGLDLSLRAGARVAVSGPSGTGKSTLGNILLGLAAPDSGAVRRAPGIAAVRYQKLYQDPAAAFAPRVTLGRSLADVMRLHGIDRARMDALLPRLRLAPALLARLPSAVSGGELQRFALLRALLLRPAFLFADEPTSRLDPVTQQETMALMLEATAENRCALLLVTHDADIAANVATDVIAL
ncbi:ABC transporter ATP-binding protein [Cupriavidus respiraculi]|uniref:ABC transporter ATP-binding protein n=1 Tax=Cupriavidus respiraculi TaxID=195930 RepID=UPI001F438B7D|nr:ATP-binding cassette domain-containing protein [Cupriavidus respiraculi]